MWVRYYLQQLNTNCALVSYCLNWEYSWPLIAAARWICVKADRRMLSEFKTQPSAPLIDVLGVAVAHREAICAWFMAILDEAASSIAASDRSVELAQGVRETKRWSYKTNVAMMHHSQGAAIIVSVYYRQRTIQSTKQSIKQQELEKATWRQKCAQSNASDGNTSGIRFCHLTKASCCNLCTSQSQQPSQLFVFFL